MRGVDSPSFLCYSIDMENKGITHMTNQTKTNGVLPFSFQQFGMGLAALTVAIHVIPMTIQNYQTGYLYPWQVEAGEIFKLK